MKYCTCVCRHKKGEAPSLLRSPDTKKHTLCSGAYTMTKSISIHTCMAVSVNGGVGVLFVSVF